MTGLDLNEYPDHERRLEERRDGVRTSLPGPSEGWVKFLIPLVLAALISYFTSQSTIREEVSNVKTTEQNHFDEVLRRLDLIQRWQDRQDSKKP